MQHLLNLKMEIIPPVALRDRHVLILLKNADGKFLLGAKAIYPEGIYRLMGGGVEAGEEVLPAAVRELQEETGLVVAPDQLKHLSTITAEIDEVSTGKHVTFVTDLFFLNVGDQKLTPADDIQDLKAMSREEVEELIQRYAELPPETDQTKGFSWFDYGQLYGAIHRIALDEVKHVEST